MGGFDPALAALDVEQAPAGLAIADPPDDAGLGAIDDRGVRTRRLAHRADAAGDDRGARAAEQPRRHPALRAVGIFDLAPQIVARDPPHRPVLATIFPQHRPLLRRPLAHPRPVAPARGPVKPLTIVSRLPGGG